MVEMDSTFTMEGVSKHNTETDLWIVSHRKVYDVSSFVGRHPGGWKVLLEHAGQDVTDVMSGLPHRHSQAAMKMLEDFYIGDLEDPEGRKTEPVTNGLVANGGSSSTSNSKQYAEIKKRYDELVNTNHPMFWEIGKLGKHYMDWVFTPGDKDLRFFKSDILENLTTCQWYVIPLFWLPIISLFLYRSYSNFISSGGSEIWLSRGIVFSVWQMPVLFVAGVIVWTLSEYIIHRWVFHLQPPHWSRVLITLHFLFHGQHHKNPMNRSRLVFPPVPAMPFALAIWFLVTSALPTATAQCILSGVALGYVIYDLIHYYLHHGTPSTDYFKDLKNYHVKHHYVYHDLGFGISSKLWDYPFGTLIPSDDDASKSK